MLVIEGFIQIIVAIIFLDVISLDCIYAKSRSCYEVENKTICYFQPLSASTPMTWEDAWNVCKEHNSTLPVIENRLIEETLKKHIKAKTTLTYQIWLAGREIRTDKWHWLNGRPFGQQSMTQGPHLPSDTHVTNVVIKEFKYVPTYAYSDKYYICQYTDSKLCQNTSFIHWTKGCLFANNYQQLKLVDARNRCLDQGGDLATFEEDEQLTLLQQNSSFLNKDKPYWIGLRLNWWIWNATAGSKEIKYSNWALYASQPKRPCLCIRLNDYKWEQSDCATKKPFLCQTVNTTENTQGTDVESSSPTGSPELPATISKELVLIIVGSVIAVAIVVVIIVVLIAVFKIPKNKQEKVVNLRANEKPTVRREMSAHRNEDKSVKMKSIEDSDVSNHYAEIPRAVDYDDNDECRDDSQPGIVYAALEFDANKAIYEDPDLRSQRKQEVNAPAKAGALNKNVESPTQAAAGTIYANL